MDPTWILMVMEDISGRKMGNWWDNFSHQKDIIFGNQLSWKIGVTFVDGTLAGWKYQIMGHAGWIRLDSYPFLVFGFWTISAELLLLVIEGFPLRVQDGWISICIMQRLLHWRIPKKNNSIQSVPLNNILVGALLSVTICWHPRYPEIFLRASVLTHGLGICAPEWPWISPAR